MLLVVRFQVKFCNKILHLCWCLIGLITLLSWILAAILYPVSIATSESCDIAIDSLNDQDVLNKALANLPEGMSDLSGVLNTCLFGDGDILGQFGVTEQLALFDEIFSNLDILDQVLDVDATSAPASQTIPPQQTIVTKTKSGLITDSSYTTQDLANLNKIVNQDSTSCTTLHDTWTLNMAACSNMGTIFHSTDGNTFNQPSATCLGYDQWMASSHDITLRYTTQFSSCSAGAVTTARNFVNKFVTNRNSINTAFTAVNNDLTIVASKYTLFSNELFNALQTFKALKQSLVNVKDSLIGQEEGLLPNSNCKFVAVGIRNVVNATCIGFVSRVFEATIVLIIVAFMMTVSTLSIFCLAKRLNLPTRKTIRP